MDLKISPHYESTITTISHPEHGLIIKKQYKRNHPCIRWLNCYLAPFYKDSQVLPVVTHESTLLHNLQPFGIVPKIYGYDKDCIYMEIAGNSIPNTTEQITKEDYLFQAKNILSVLSGLGIKHNDLLAGNVLLHNGILKIIDFTLSEYNDIRTGDTVPDRSWGRFNEDYLLLLHADYFPEELNGEAIIKARKAYKDVAKSVYNYHNLGVGHYDAEMNEKTPCGHGERYNFDRFAMMVQHYDFSHKNVLDIGCNSGWFCFQTKLLGAQNVLGIDFTNEGIMGDAFRYAFAFEGYMQTGVRFLNRRIETLQSKTLCYTFGIDSFDAIFVLSVLHHIANKKEIMTKLYDCCSDVIFYEDHEFWNELYDDNNKRLTVEGEGHRYNWNKDISWQQKMGSLERHEPLVIESFKNSWRREALLLDKYSSIKLLGFSEKRRPVLAFHK